ncbi:DUF1194 domain-containing protein [Aquibium carbonis]|uniref:DUF1194 domain-containing protein n=1 Tax=Aquibium carbonis TaxID=2495581 RepID=A0A3S0A143_9HYPH|nr:DUF1194 domain-containing protein [Aquibium carbonis]RST81721.1 DUF1194 domain-containing protein [Aquibium carbonis]
MSRHPILFAAACLVGAFLVAAPLAAQTHPEDDEVVDVELVLAVDVSLSMSPMELELQRDGYAAALVHDQVMRAIKDGVHGKIAVVYFEWAGDFMQHVVVPWTRISSEAEAQAFVAQMTASPPRSARRTSISGALLYADRLFDNSGYRGLKRVIDVSGDGPNNQGEPVAETRDAITAKGITINGLPLMTSGGFASSFDVNDLDVYYQNCVIGGPGAFVIPVNDWSQFPEAIRRKLVLELAMDQPAWPAPTLGPVKGPPVVLAQSTPGYDCLIGERIWQNRQRYWEN